MALVCGGAPTGRALIPVFLPGKKGLESDPGIGRTDPEIDPDQGPKGSRRVEEDGNFGAGNGFGDGLAEATDPAFIS